MVGAREGCDFGMARPPISGAAGLVRCQATSGLNRDAGPRRLSRGRCLYLVIVSEYETMTNLTIFMNALPLLVYIPHDGIHLGVQVGEMLGQVGTI
jgi:hypothetical protein